MHYLIRWLFGLAATGWKENEMTPITTEEELQAALSQSQEGPVLLLKHSTTCPISARAFEAVRAFSESATQDDIKVYVILVIENRSISNQLTEISGIRHESPQAMLAHQERFVWNASHGGINSGSLEEAVAEIGKR